MVNRPNSRDRVKRRSPKDSPKGVPDTPVASSTDTSNRLSVDGLNRTVLPEKVSLSTLGPGPDRVFFPTTAHNALRVNVKRTLRVNEVRRVTGKLTQNGTLNSISIGASDQSLLKRFESSWNTPRSQLTDADRGP